MRTTDIAHNDTPTACLPWVADGFASQAQQLASWRSLARQPAGLRCGVLSRYRFGVVPVFGLLVRRSYPGLVTFGIYTEWLTAVSETE